ncbi:hypothetical protein ASPCADRAFT_2165 [Aspergillus carbonarius ITEM 5010]|uniref:Uncharacterized protein n=1 Tax=Aspergillus carbonarius (strain ITEM 5010) TaxID=602072 RepID=A0A1R3RWA4_ASPC5|nr:hypothetical protein ASPCADRAFT_2165 [Aspergillus carbonarius ITEM 5010]
MSERKKIYYTYKSIEAWEKYDEEVRKIITEDTDKGNLDLQPGVAAYLEVTPETIKKLKDLNDDVVVVAEIED